MIPDEKLLRAVVARHSAPDAHRVLTEQGYVVSMERCRNLRSQLRHEGVAEKLLFKPRESGMIPTYNDPAVDAERGSLALLRAHLVTGKHWITDPARFASACQSAGLAA